MVYMRIVPGRPSQVPTHRFLRSVAPRKAFLGTAWRAFSLRSLGDKQREKVSVREAMVRSEANGLLVMTFQHLVGLLLLRKLWQNEQTVELETSFCPNRYTDTLSPVTSPLGRGWLQRSSQ